MPIEGDRNTSMVSPRTDGVTLTYHNEGQPSAPGAACLWKVSDHSIRTLETQTQEVIELAGEG